MVYIVACDVCEKFTDSWYEIAIKVEYRSRKEGGCVFKDEFDTGGEIHLCEDCYKKLLSDAIEKLRDAMMRM